MQNEVFQPQSPGDSNGDTRNPKPKARRRSAKIRQEKPVEKIWSSPVLRDAPENDGGEFGVDDTAATDKPVASRRRLKKRVSWPEVDEVIVERRSGQQFVARPESPDPEPGKECTQTSSSRSFSVDVEVFLELFHFNCGVALVLSLSFGQRHSDCFKEGNCCCSNASIVLS